MCVRECDDRIVRLFEKVRKEKVCVREREKEMKLKSFVCGKWKAFWSVESQLEFKP